MDLSNGAFIESFHSSSPELETDWDWSTKSLRQTMMAFAERQRDDIKNEWINILKLRFRENYDRDYRPQPLAEENQKTSEPQPDLSDEDRLPRENSMLPLGNFVEHLVGENSCEAQTSENQVLDISLSKSDEHLMGKVSCESSTSETPIASINLSGKRIHVIGSYHKARKKNPTTNTKVLREIQYGISEIASDSTAEAGKIAIDHKEETNIAICLEILVTDRVGLLDMHAKDGYIAMEALSEVLQSTQPLIDYFPDSSQWWYKAVPKSKRNEFAEKIQKLMYVSFDEYPCVRLLNLSGQIGRSNPGLNKVVAPIIKLKDVKELDQPHTILVTADEMEEFFTKVSNDLSFGSKIGGVLVESGSNFQQKLKGFSLDKKFPQAQFSHYENVEYKWNSAAPSIMWKNYNFPAYLLSESGISAVQEILFKKKMKHKTYTSDVAKFNRVMETTKIGTHNSEACLGEGTCLPLGRYSVWSSLPPINVSSSNNRKPIVLTAASMDSASFFRDKSFGADSPISGMVALLGAVDALSRVDGFSNLKKQLVFLVLTGETWGYLGSRRFLHELDLHSDAVAGLSDTPIETVLEIGSVGKGLSGGTNTFFAHKTRASSATNMTLDALKIAQDSLKSKNIKILSADTANPGIPPSSLMAFMRKNPQTSAVLLEDFDTKFVNKFYHSHLDDLSNINSSSVVAAASVVARTLYILASDSKDTSNSALGSIHVNTSFIEELLSCLLACEPGLSCNLLKDYISPANTCPGNYAGVILGEPSSKPYLGYVGDVSRFLWNFLADKTSFQKGNTTSVCSKGVCSKTNEVCIKAENNKEGTCVVSTTRYVPAYSTRLKYNDGAWTILPQNSSDSMGMVDPVWTESNWDTIRVHVYTVQHSAYDNAVLIAGITVTTLAYIGIWVAKSIIRKALKQD